MKRIYSGLRVCVCVCVFECMMKKRNKKSKRKRNINSYSHVFVTRIRLVHMVLSLKIIPKSDVFRFAIQHILWVENTQLYHTCSVYYTLTYIQTNKHSVLHTYALKFTHETKNSKHFYKQTKYRSKHLSSVFFLLLSLDFSSSRHRIIKKSRNENRLLIVFVL